MDPSQREALASLRLTWAPTADDLWHSQGAVHVGGLNEFALDDVDAAFTDAARNPESNPLGVVIQGQAGTGKTHLLGQVRERVQAQRGYFLLVELLDATSFWQSAHGGILESLGRPGGERDTQLKDLLWELSTLAHVTRADRRAIAGDDDLEPEAVERFVNALYKEHKATIREAQHTLRALVLFGAGDLGQQDIGQAFLSGSEPDDAAKERWRLPKPTLTPQESVRQMSRIVALAGPAVLAIDQIDTLLAQSAESTEARGRTDNRDLEHVAHGLMSIRQTMRRTPAVVACLPVVWKSIENRAVGSVADRFRVTHPLKALASADLGRAILERRFTASYRNAGFAPPYPSWPIRPSAFTEAVNFTPRELLKRADAHVRRCLEGDTVVELTSFQGSDDVIVVQSGDHVAPLDKSSLDARFVEYRRRAVPAAALESEGEDTTMPALLGAALDAWIAERGEDERTFRQDPPKGQRPSLHARLRQSLDSEIDDERHWAFRAIATNNAIAAQTRIRNASSAVGSGSGKRRLFLLRNAPWPSGKKTAALVSDFEAAGGHTLHMSEDDLRTLTALRDLVDDNDPDLPAWLRARRPAHGLTILRDALGELAGDAPPPVPDIELVDVPQESESVSQQEHSPVSHSQTSVTVGADVTTDSPVAVDLAALRKHTVIFAGSGSGKTVLIRRLVEECALRGVSSIVLDPNNDLSRLGSPWPQPPGGWHPADDARAEAYFAGTEVVVWTPRKDSGRPLSFQPLPDFAGVLDNPEEFDEAIESAVAALEPRALITGGNAKAMQSRAVLKVALRHYARTASPATLPGFIAMLSDLPDGVSGLPKGPKLAAELAANLHAAMVNDPLFGGHGAPADPGVLLTPSPGRRARVSVINMVGLTSDQQREGFVNQLQMALFSWIKRHPAGDRPLGGLLVMDEAQNFAPSDRYTACTRSTLALVSQARKYGLGLVFATQAPRGLHNYVPGNAATQFYGLLNSPAQIATAKEMARVKGGEVPDISKLRAGNFYVALEGESFHRIRAPWCLSHHPQSPPTTDEVLALAREGGQ
jgi:hypothetical protein